MARVEKRGPIGTAFVGKNAHALSQDSPHATLFVELVAHEGLDVVQQF